MKYHILVVNLNNELNNVNNLLRDIKSYFDTLSNDEICLRDMLSFEESIYTCCDELSVLAKNIINLRLQLDFELQGEELK